MTLVSGNTGYILILILILINDVNTRSAKLIPQSFAFWIYPHNTKQ